MLIDTIAPAEASSLIRRMVVLVRPRFQTGYLKARGKWWTARYWEPCLGEDGKLTWRRPRVRLGLRSEMSKRQAEAKLAEVLAPINQGAFKPQSVTRFRDYVERTWRELVRPELKHSTATGYDRILKKHLTPYFGDMQLAAIDRLTVTEFMRLQAVTEREIQTQRNILCCLSSVFQSAVNFQLLAGNPARGVNIAEWTESIEATAADLEPEERIPTPAEFELYLESIAEPVRTMVLLVALLGLRIGELIALKWRDIDLAVATLYVRRNIYAGRVQLPKGQKSRKRRASAKGVPLGPLAVYLLEKHHRESRPPNTDTPVFPNDLGRHHWDGHNLLNRVLKPAGEKWAKAYREKHQKQPPAIRWHWHLFKHVYGTEAQRQAQAPADFQRLTRHETPAVTLEHYAHTVPEHLRAAQGRIERAIAPITSKMAEPTSGVE